MPFYGDPFQTEGCFASLRVCISLDLEHILQSNASAFGA